MAPVAESATAATSANAEPVPRAEDIPQAEAVPVGQPASDAPSPAAPAVPVFSVPAFLELLQPVVRDELMAFMAQQTTPPAPVAAAGAAAPAQSGGERRRARRQLEQAMVGPLRPEIVQAAQERVLATVEREVQAWRHDERVLRALGEGYAKGKAKGKAPELVAGAAEPVARFAEAVPKGDARGKGKGKGKGK